MESPTMAGSFREGAEGTGEAHGAPPPTPTPPLSQFLAPDVPSDDQADELVRSSLADAREMDTELSSCDTLESMPQHGSSGPHNLTLEFLRNITNNFSDDRLLGEGGFGTVYKGLLPNGETVAVKKLHSSLLPGAKDNQFENEARHLKRLKHPNIVLLVGWCCETEIIPVEYDGKQFCVEKLERLLCLEYMPKGNLLGYLSDESSGLTWETRYKIIEGICYGLHYLHEESQLNAPIIHMDLKPENILLDNNMVPKIADFGLSRLFTEKRTKAFTKSRDGTLGYMAPEYIKRGMISTKSDIFSLGVIIIEIVTGERDYPDETGEISSQEFTELVLKSWRNRLQKSLRYTSLEIDYQQIRTCIQIGLDCVKLDRSKRPTTSQVIKMLIQETERAVQSHLTHIDDNQRQGIGRSMEVVSASHGALGPLLGKLTALLADEYTPLNGVRREIRSLRSELTRMQAAVLKYSMLEDPEVQVKAWISLVRELAYDIEDVIDKFIHQLGDGSHQSQSGFKELCRNIIRRFKTLGSGRGIANQIDDLNVRVMEVKEHKSSYKLDDATCHSSEHWLVDPRLSALFEATDIVGLDGPRDTLVNWMLEDKKSSAKHRRVLSIVGFGGLGKTTLAKAVYDKIKGHFHCHAFVSVSQKPNVKKIMKYVLFQVPSDKTFMEGIDTWDDKKHVLKLRELLQDKRYLIIIDDIWSIPAWEAIKYAFPENNFSSRIIATTRIVDVAKSCCLGGNDRMYEMEALSDLHSKKLFFKRTFGSESCCPDVLKEVSNEILKKCGGLPLAIISISGLLANKPFLKYEWEKVRRSIGSALDNHRSLEGMNSILYLSYNDLPSNLKTCLLYLSIFPEDCVIGRERLVRRWIAEGFISEERGLSKEEVAENHFYELINRSIVQPVDVGYDGKARACQVHDMMLKLITSKSIEDNFISLVGHRQTDLVNRDCYIRRLSVQHIDQELGSVMENQDLRHVRSLTVITSSCVKHLPSLVEFAALRVLDFEGCKSLQEYDMNGIDKLFQLKYLGLRGTNMSEIPSGIVKLYDLEMLDLRDNDIEELPSRIVELTKLQHLLVRRYQFGSTKIPDGIGNMTNLRVITGFNITKSSLGAVAELGNLTSLNELHLQLDGRGSEKYKRYEEMLLSSLCKLGTCKLKSLGICSSDSQPLLFLDSLSPLPSCLQRFQMTVSYDLLKIPKWITPALTCLACLDINLAKANEEDLFILGEMPALVSLRLTFRTDQEERLTIRGHGFPCLKELFIFSYPGHGATNILFKEGALPKLEKLNLPFVVSWLKANGFYLGIGHLPCLKYATITLRNDGCASPSEIRAAAAALKNEAESHSNHPRLIIGGVVEEGEEEIGNDEKDGDSSEEQG